MEVGRLLSYTIFIVVPIIAIIVYISITSQIKPIECKNFISGQTLKVLGDFGNCIKGCWNKHGFGKDVYSDDCFIVRVIPNATIEKNTIESFFNKTIPVKVYFDSLERNREYYVKFRYNASFPEISLLLFE